MRSSAKSWSVTEKQLDRTCGQLQVLHHRIQELRVRVRRIAKQPRGNYATCIGAYSSLKSQVVSLQTAHSWANAGVLLGDACIGSGVAFEAIKLLGWS